MAIGWPSTMLDHTIMLPTWPRNTGIAVMIPRGTCTDIIMSMNHEIFVL